MAARGARSRKVVEKEIHKQEDKRQPERWPSHPSSIRPDSNRVMSPVASWGRKNSITTSGGASIHSRDSSSSNHSGAGAKIVDKLTMREDEKYLAGKTGKKKTSAPRGRGGGVPVKASEATNERMAYSSVRSRSMNSSSSLPRPRSRAPTLDSEGNPPVKSWDRTRIWYGGLTPKQPFRGFEHVGSLHNFVFKCGSQLTVFRMTICGCRMATV